MTVGTSDYILSRETLDTISKEIASWLETTDYSSKEILRIRLTMEELLFQIMERGGSERSIRLSMQKRFGRHMLLVRYGGEAFDPITSSRDEQEEVCADILSRLGMMPSWSYRDGMNTIQLFPPKLKGRGTLGCLLLAVLLAAVMGALGSFFPMELRENVIRLFLAPLTDAFLGLLTTFAGIMVFLTVALAVAGAENVSVVSRMAKNLFSSMMGIVFGASFLFCLISRLFFPRYAGITGDMREMQAVSEMIFHILPHDPVTPFQSGNIMQILVLAISTGLVLILVKERGRTVKMLIGDGSTVVNTIMEYVCKLIPAYVFASLLRQIWSGALREFLGIWKPVVTACAVNLALSAAVLLFTAARVKCSPFLILKKVFPASLIAFSTASCMAAYTTGVETCEKQLGIEKRLVDFAYPIANVVYMPAGALVADVVCVYLAACYQVETSIAWFILCGLLGAVLSVAAPPVPGAGLTCIAILLEQLSIPTEGMLQAIALLIVLDYFISLFDVFMLQVTMIWQAHRLHMLDLDVLRKTPKGRDSA